MRMCSRCCIERSLEGSSIGSCCEGRYSEYRKTGRVRCLCVGFLDETFPENGRYFRIGSVPDCRCEYV